jgi:hypothetical protein
MESYSSDEDTNVSDGKDDDDLEILKKISVLNLQHDLEEEDAD